MIPTPEVTMDGDGGYAIVACSLGPGDLARRAARWQALTARALVQASRTDGGLRLVFGAAPGVSDELNALVALERDCCGFAAWSVREGGDEVTLEILAHGEPAVAAIRAMFPALT
jgi:hypothetical protein